jgi:hypothetical protein
MLGEAPVYREVSVYVGELWNGWPHAASMVRNCWRSVYRAKTSRGRGTHRHSSPLYQPDRLIELHGLQPVTEVRLAAMVHEATDRLLGALYANDTVAYRNRKRELDAALLAVENLGYLRYGSVFFDVNDLSPQPARRPKWW